MKIFFAVMAFGLISTGVFADEYVRGHMRDTDGDGVKDTYVDSYYRSSPDNSRYNNYSTKGNYNPYTGEKGHEAPDRAPSSSSLYGGSSHRKGLYGK